MAEADIIDFDITCKIGQGNVVYFRIDFTNEKVKIVKNTSDPEVAKLVDVTSSSFTISQLATRKNKYHLYRFKFLDIEKGTFSVDSEELSFAARKSARPQVTKGVCSSNFIEVLPSLK